MTEQVSFGFWVVDSYGRNLYCRNGANLTLEEALIGSLTYNGRGDYVALDKAGKELGAGTLYHARKLVEEHTRKTER